MKRALLDGLTAPLRYKLLGLAVALVLGFVLTAGAVLMQLVGQVGFLAACVFGIVMGAIDPYALDDIPDFVINLLGLLIGFLSLVIMAKVLKSQWSKKPVKTDEALDSGLISED